LTEVRRRRRGTLDEGSMGDQSGHVGKLFPAGATSSSSDLATIDGVATLFYSIGAHGGWVS
ncbi:MAG: hypothetical protein ACKOUR_01245, partial [Planctomycetota bacterium]